MSENRKSLWMRDIDFSKMRGVLRLISEHDGQLQAKDLESLGIKTGIFVRRSSRPFSHTTMYHYRKVMEHLNLVRVEKQRYFLEGSSELAKLVWREEYRQELSPEQKEFFADVILRNADCQRHFFSIFSLKQDTFKSIHQFRTEASHIVAQTAEKGAVVLKNPKTAASIVLDTNDKLQAIFWGVRLWALDLELTDELFVYPEGRLIFPVLAKGSVEVSQIIDRLLRELQPGDPWATFGMPDITRRFALSLRLSTTELHDAIRMLRNRFPQFVDFIPTSESFINIRTPFWKQDNVIFKGYIKDSQGRFISHVRLHREIWEKYAAKEVR